MQTAQRQITVHRSATNWIVRVSDAHSTQSYVCATERMALRFAEVFTKAGDEAFLLAA